MSNSLTVSVIDSAAALAPYGEAWNELLSHSRSRSICLRWEWVQTWLAIYGDCGVKPYVLLVREGDQLIGIAPFFVQIEKKWGRFGVRTLRFLGTGEPEWEEVASEYLDVISRPGLEADVMWALWQHLDHANAWDRYVFNDVLKDSLIFAQWAQKPQSAGCAVTTEQIGIRYQIDLPRTWDDYLAMLEPGAAKRIQYKRRKLERAGKVVDRVVTHAQELENAFSELVRLHTLRWSARGDGGVFASPRFTAFHKKLAHQLLPQGMLNIRLLMLESAAIAVLYNIRDAGTDYFYQGGFDVEQASKFSPGIMAHVYAIDSAIRDGLRQYDFMKGGTDSYKSEFACGETSMYDVWIYGRTPVGRILAWERVVKDRLRPVRQGLSRLVQALKPAVRSKAQSD